MHLALLALSLLVVARPPSTSAEIRAARDWFGAIARDAEADLAKLASGSIVFNSTSGRRACHGRHARAKIPALLRCLGASHEGTVGQLRAAWAAESGLIFRRATEVPRPPSPLGGGDVYTAAFQADGGPVRLYVSVTSSGSGAARVTGFGWWVEAEQRAAER